MGGKSKAQERREKEAEREYEDAVIHNLQQFERTIYRPIMWLDLLRGRSEKLGIDFLMTNIPTIEIQLCARLLVCFDCTRVLLSLAGAMPLSFATLYQMGTATALWMWC